MAKRNNEKKDRSPPKTDRPAAPTPRDSGRTLSTITLCKVNEAVRITIDGKSMKLAGFGYPRLGRIREYTSDELDQGVPFYPCNSSGHPLDPPAQVIGNLDAAGMWSKVIENKACDAAVTTYYYFVIWWQYENYTSVHICSEAIKVAVPKCSSISDCPP